MPAPADPAAAAVTPRDLDPERHALFVDFDGTLVEIAPSPGSVRPAPYLPDLLARLQARLGGALAVVSGRAVDDIERLLAPLSPVVAGLHGRDRRLPGGGRRKDPFDPATLDEVRASLGEVAARFPGTLLEDKGESVALHYRNAPEAAADASAAARAVADGRPDLRLLPGKMVVELLPAGSDKGRAVDELRRLPPFAGRAPVFVGDDVTDEAGFAAANRAGGLSVRVGDGAATAASARLPSVAALHAWLARAAGVEIPAGETGS